MRKRQILRAGSYAYNPYKFVSFKINGIEVQMPEPLEDIENELEHSDMKEAKEVIACLMKKS